MKKSEIIDRLNHASVMYTLAIDPTLFKDAITALTSEREKSARVREALIEIRDLEPEPFEFPADWKEQIAACSECERYKHHPIQRGICDTHRKPLWQRDAHEKSERSRLGWRAKQIARAALEDDNG